MMITVAIKMIAFSALGWLLYKALLARRPLFVFNRFFLLAILVLPIVLPWVSIEWPSAAPVIDLPLPASAEPTFWVVPAKQVPAALPAAEAGSRLAWPDLVLLAYGLVATWLMGRLLLALWATRLHCVGGYKAELAGHQFVALPRGKAPFSFFGKVYLPEALLQQPEALPAIWRHEDTHARQWHTIDVLLVHIVQACCWFNPVVWWVGRAIRLNHEYLADRKACADAGSAVQYLQALHTSFQLQSSLSLAHAFSMGELSKRIHMLGKHCSARARVAITLLATLALLLAALPAMQLSVVAAQPATTQKSNTDTLTASGPAATPDPRRVEQWKRMTYKYATTPAPAAVLEEYQRISAVDTTQPKWWLKRTESVSATDRKRLLDLYVQMTPEQQLAQYMKFIKRGGPLQKATPTAEQFERFKNPKLYGVWINDKRVPNSALDRYTAKDFAQFDVSKLYGAAKKGRSYTHQVNMMTNDYYAAYLAQTKATADEPLLVIAWVWKDGKR